MITQKQVKQLFKYESGKLFWRVRSARNVFIGSEAGCLMANGYTTIRINKKNYYAHRIVFLYHHGYLPEFLDHIDVNPSNNKIENIRPATRSQNGSNLKLRNANSSGHKGVMWCKSAKLWVARLSFKGNRINLGCFWDLDVAVQALKIERLRLHGEFANHG